MAPRGRRAARGGRHDDRAAAVGKRERTKAANREAILVAARARVQRHRLRRGAVRDIVRETDLATGTFYNYFPDKESVLRALVDEIAVEARARVRAARTARDDARGVRRRRLPRLLRVPGRGPRHGRADAPQRGDDPHDVRRARRSGAGIDELRADLETAVAPGRIPPHDADLMAAAMVGAGVEVGLRMVERDPPDVERAVAFVTECSSVRLNASGSRAGAPQLGRG